MAKQLRKLGPIVIALAVIGVLAILPFAQSDPPTDGPCDPGGPPAPLPVNPGLARTVRAAVGFGPTDVLPAVAGDENHQQMIGDGIGFCAEDEEPLASLVAARQEVHNQLVYAITWGKDTAPIYEQLAAAHEALAEAAQAMLPTLSQDLTAEQAASMSQVAENLALDPELRTLALTAEQRAAITAAQRERDAVILNASNWYQRVKCQQANDEYETAVQSILTADQSAKLAANRELLASRLEEMVAAEASADAAG